LLRHAVGAIVLGFSLLRQELGQPPIHVDEGEILRLSVALLAPRMTRLRNPTRSSRIGNNQCFWPLNLTKSKRAWLGFIPLLRARRLHLEKAPAVKAAQGQREHGRCPASGEAPVLHGNTAKLLAFVDTLLNRETHGNVTPFQMKTAQQFRWGLSHIQWSG
jgi:hypothetical protein